MMTGLRRRRIRLGTRSSNLAVWQAQEVASLLRARGVECDIVRIETRGDDIPEQPLPEIGGDGVFTERIERSLLVSEIDIAVHSLKDLPVEQSHELFLGAVLGREEAREVFISRGGLRLAELPLGAVIGSSSTRRQAQLLSRRPDLTIRPIRGNVETRIRKVESGQFDATVLAGVGVLRLGLAGKISEWFDLSDILPAPGQGAIAVQCRSEDVQTRSLLAEVDQPGLRAETEAERGFLRALGGGCSAPVGAFAYWQGQRLHLHGRVCAADGSRSVDVRGEGTDLQVLVAEVADRALHDGAAQLIASAFPSSSPQPAGAQSLRGLRVLVTRARNQAEELCRKLVAAGAVPVSIPMIRIAPVDNARDLDSAIRRLDSHDWLVFASANCVEFFMSRLHTTRPEFRWTPGAPRIAAIGPGTAAALAPHGVSADLVPEVHTAVCLAEAILRSSPKGLGGVRVLMPRALEGRTDAAAFLRRHGAVVEEVPIYRTDAHTPTREELQPLGQGVDAVLFTSSSAVSAWCEQIRDGGPLAEAAGRAIIACIGPSTASTARERGLQVQVESPMHTIDGLLSALGRHVARARGGPR
jgi:hydroxymethylbilane synthase